MADTTTTAYGLTKPEIGASEDTWGTKINTDLDTLDTVVNAIGGKTAAGTLSYANSAKLATTATGVDVTGTVTADGLTVEGPNSATVSIIAPTDNATLEIRGGNSDAGVEEANIVFYQNNAGKWQLGNATDNSFKLYNYAVSNYALTIDSNNDISFYEDTGTTPKFFWDASAESLGIGTSSPSAKLEVSGPSVSGYGQFVIKSDTVPQMTWYQGTTLEANAYADGSKMVLGSITSTPLVLRTTGTERMRIDSSGNVGIGTSSPTAKLTVQTSAGSLSVDALGGGSAQITSPTSLGFNVASAYNHHFYVNSSEVMRIDSSGNVGIGTTSPSAKIHSVDSNGNVLRLQRDGAFTGSWDVDIGSFTTGDFTIYDNENSQRAIAIAKLTGFSGNSAVYIDSSGATSIGTTTSSGQLTVKATADRAAGSFIVNANGDSAISIKNSSSTTVGTIVASASATAYNTSSDYRLKTDAQPMTGASARVQALNPVNFEWIADGTRVDGFLAHEAQAVVPEAVTGTKDAMRDEEYEVTPAVLDDNGNVVTEAVMGTRSVPDYQGIDQSKLVPLLTAALQEALTKIDALETRITALEG